MHILDARTPCTIYQLTESNAMYINTSDTSTRNSMVRMDQQTKDGT